MDIDKRSFYGCLLDVLQAISEAEFVSIDLELSGVASKSATAARSKQTVQQRYEEVKEAAERYQILQIGLTCARLDRDLDVYVVQPYNFTLSPLIEERLDLERIFSFQSGAAEFLLSHGFDISQPFTRGVPYLTHDESKLARKIAPDRLDKSAYEDIHLKPEDVESLDFVAHMRTLIDAWVDKWTKDGKPSSAVFDIETFSPASKNDKKAVPRDIGRFEKRLLHQLVRTSYPDLVTVPRQSGIRITPFDQARENRIRLQKQKRVNESIYRQTGFRWIVDALRGASLEELHHSAFAVDPDTGHSLFSPDWVDIKSRYARAKEHLKRKRPVLVGHNCFTDLVYFYNTFVSSLPSTITEFQERLHAIFPTIVDTKYMATHNCGDISPASSLEQIEEQLRQQLRPRIDMHPKHTKYMGEQALLHEAGFDSYLTALVMVRLSAKLGGEGKGGDVNAGVVDTAQEPVPSENDAASTPSIHAVPLSVKGTPDTPSTSSYAKSTKGGNAKSPTSSVVSSGIAHQNPFALLDSITAATDRHGLSNSTSDEGRRRPTVSSAPLPLRPSSDRLTTGRSWRTSEALEKEKGAIMRTMPPFESEFWTVYGNKLRLFGTVEGVLHLN